MNTRLVTPVSGKLKKKSHLTKVENTVMFASIHWCLNSQDTQL